MLKNITVILLGQILTMCLILASVAGCVSQSPAAKDPDNDTPAAEPEATPAAQTESAISEQVKKVAVDVLTSLGYDLTTLEFIGASPSPNDANLWSVTYNNQAGSPLIVDVNVELNHFEFIKGDFTKVDSLPGTLKPGEDLDQRVAEALDFEGEGYKRVEWAGKLPGPIDYWKVETVDGWTVRTGLIAVAVMPETNVFLGLFRFERPLSATLNVNVDREEIKKRGAALYNSDVDSILYAELIQTGKEHGSTSDTVLFWEVRFSDGMFLLANPEDGTFRELPTMDLPK